jgi:pSer/pThr/pTyr-binding forkhead associated (FHA) protein
MPSFWVKYRGTRFPLRRGETILGRSPYCTIVMPNQLASRQHCTLRLEGDVLMLTDLASANGTWLNGERADQPRQLRHGDLVRVGTDVLEILIGDRASTSRRTRKDTDDAGQQSAFLDDEVSTQSLAMTVELIEALVSSANATRRPGATITTVQRALDVLLAQLDAPLSRTERTRLVAIVETVAEWCDSREVAAWRERTLQALAGSEA